MLCALSGSVPSFPVVSKKSGHLFEKALIEKYLLSEDLCPITGNALSVDDLLPVQAAQAARPRPITATSIPGLLSHFQNEWDEVMLETFTLKQHLDATRKELSQVLYQHDAACRVIARLTRERDEARAMLSSSQGQVAAAAVHAAERAAGGATSMDVVESETPSVSSAAAAAAAGITQPILDALSVKGKELSKRRKKRITPAALAEPNDIKVFAETSTASPHATKEPNGVTCVDLHPTVPSMTVSGGMDSNAVLYDHTAGRDIATLRGHSKRLNAALFHPDASRSIVLTASADKLVKLWSSESATATYVEAATIGEASGQGAFGGEVTGISVHPTGDFAACSSKDGSWSFVSLSYGGILETVRSAADSSPSAAAYSSVCFHPDGLLLGVGSCASSHTVDIWDVKTRGKIHSFGGHSGPVRSLDFSENGYFMASTGANGEVKLWDLRKLKNLKSLTLPGGVTGSCVRFDHSGTYLAVGGGSSVVVAAVKDWEQIVNLTGHTKDVTAVNFSSDARCLASASLDRTVKLWA
jgi:pre-mRNA-processing factor 19